MKSGIIFLFQYHYENFELEETHKRRGGVKKLLSCRKQLEETGIIGLNSPYSVYPKNNPECWSSENDPDLFFYRIVMVVESLILNNFIPLC